MRKILTTYIPASMLLAFLAMVLLTCGGGGGGSSSPSWDGPINSAGYPDVAGIYSFNTSNISSTCTDGTNGVDPPLALNLEISQSDNRLFGFNPTASTIPGLTIIEANDLAGNVEKTGYFIMNQNVVAIIDSVPGENTIHYSVSGYFNLTGWDGNYEYSIFNDYYNVSCTFKTNFTGDYIGPLANQAATMMNPYGEVFGNTILEETLNDVKFFLGYRF